MDTKSKIQIMQAFLDGKKIQWTGGGSEWSDFDGEPIWNWLQYDYRIKPEPREWAVFVDGDGEIFSNGYTTAQGRFIKVREVLE